MKPMIAQKANKLHTLQYPTIIEKKYDGYRAFVIRENSTTRIISARENKDETQREHLSILLRDLRNLPPGTYDGEIYNPRYPGQAAARTDENKNELRYCIFDDPTSTSPYNVRSKELLIKILLTIASSNGKIHSPYQFGVVENQYQLKKSLEKILKENTTKDGIQLIEGVIYKPLNSPYVTGERKHWVKLKRVIT